jgi:hypothetical protein
MELERACRGDGELQDGKNEFYGANLIVLQDGLKSIITWSLRKLCGTGKRRVTSHNLCRGGGRLWKPRPPLLSSLRW